MTIGLSLISRTVTDVRISSQIEESGRAFSAAEAGVENALKVINVLPIGPTRSITLNNASADYSVSDIGGNSSLYTFPLTEANSSQLLWLVNHNSNGSLGTEFYPTDKTIDICWGTTGNNSALELSLYYKTGTTYKIAKSAYDPDIARGNNFNPADKVGNYCNSSYLYKHAFNFIADFGVDASDVLLALRMTPVYENTSIGVLPAATVNLPVQGNQINSVGKSSTGVVRKIQVNKTYNMLPGLLDFALYCESSCQ